MTLKELIASDVQDVFFALDDFAEEHLVEGKKIDVVVDTDRFVLFPEHSEMSGVGPQDLVFFARTEDLRHVPRRVTGALLSFDNKEYLVDKWVENMGVSEIQAHQNRGI